MRRGVNFLVDLILIAAATLAAVFLRDNLEYVPHRYHAVWPYLGLTLISAAVFLPLSRASTTTWRFSSLSDYVRTSVASILIVMGALIAGFVYNRLDGIARSIPVLQGLMTIFLLVGVRVLRRLQHANHRRTTTVSQVSPFSGQETVLIVGLTRVADLYVRSIAEFAPLRVGVAGFLGTKDKQLGTSVHQKRVLGRPEDVAKVIRELSVHGVIVDKIVIAKPFVSLSPEAQAALLDLEESTTIKLEFLTTQLGLDAKPLAQQERTTFVFSPEELKSLQRKRYWSVKRAMDFLAAAILIVATAPIMLIVAFLVAIDVGFPIVFSQQRPGRRGIPFDVFKFRTMRAAHDKHGTLIPDRQRTSRIGHFLRRTRLDELPQLFSILAGRMSFVGPRPLLPIDQPAEFSARLLVRPGLTGWAQVNGGRDVSAADKAALDVWYAANASLSLDLKILARTVPMVLRGERVSPDVVWRTWHDLVAAGICTTQFVPQQLGGNPAIMGSRQAA